MNSNHERTGWTVSAFVAAMLAAAVHAPALAQDGDKESTAGGQPEGSQADALSEVVVTAAAGDKTRLRSSISVSDVGNQQIQDFTPRSEAEVFRLIPGIRAEDTAGPGGNSNI